MHSEQDWEAWADALADREYVVIDGYLPDELLALLEHFFQQHQDALQQAKVGALDERQEALSVRSDLTYWLDRERDKGLSPLFAWIEESLQRWNRLLYLSLSGYEFHLAYYPTGGHYRKHLDQFRGRNNRLISCVLYLNENWKVGDGGELQLY
ncbi:MAG TPA: 2OG-Fe(II) oxygenase, partial [Cryomorphaceae bacterium]|nr:2OG-Fe(II) oxygenase [Cryomorphaceae bacterium]